MRKRQLRANSVLAGTPSLIFTATKAPCWLESRL